MSRRQRAVAELSVLSLRSGDPDELLTHACRLVSEAVGLERGHILELDADRGEAVLRAGFGWQPDLVGTLRIGTAEGALSGSSLADSEPVVSRDIRAEGSLPLPAYLQEAGVVSLARVPVLLPGGRVYGLLQADATNPHEFHPGDPDFLRTFASILGLAIDRLQGANRLRAMEERFQLTVENARDYAIFIADADDRITHWFAGAEAVFGWTAAEAVGRSGSMLFTPEDRDRRQDAEELGIARSQGAAPNYRWHLRQDGQRVFIDGSVRALRDEKGELRGYLKIGQDMTERRRTEELLRESEARFRHMADSAPALIWMTDGNGRLTFANMHFAHLFGRPIAEMLAEGWQAVVVPDDLEPFLDRFGEAFEGRRPFRTQVRAHDAAGRLRWLDCQGVPRQDDGGRFLGYTGCSVDITDARLAAEELERRVVERSGELLAAEDSLRQAQKMEAVGQLTGGIAHDFNNMLQGATGGLDLAHRRISEGRAAEAARYLNLAQEAVNRAAGLTRRLLAFARRQRLEPRAVDADGLVAGLADLIRRTMGPAVGVDLQLRNGVGTVLCDPNELESAILNLCINARDAMPAGGRLAISTHNLELSAADIRLDEVNPGRFVVVSVADTGTGMPPDVMERVFEPFFTTKPQGEGTGLGLSQVYGFVRQSGGVVRVESTVGKGTVVRILLPLRDQVEAAEAEEASQSGTSGSVGTVLLVDDEDAARRPMADLLREHGHRVLEARDGPEALDILASVRPDVLVTDVGLPHGMNGRQVAEAARERVPGLPVLFVTGYSGAVLPPGVAVIAKPFKLEALAQRIQSMLESGESVGLHGSAREPPAVG